MRNINTSVDEDAKKLTIVVDLTKDFGPSKSQKTIIIASTDGNQRIENADVYLGLNVYKKKTA